jgi:hypothetical protein
MNVSPIRPTSRRGGRVMEIFLLSTGEGSVKRTFSPESEICAGVQRLAAMTIPRIP